MMRNKERKKKKGKHSFVGESTRGQSYCKLCASKTERDCKVHGVRSAPRSIWKTRRPPPSLSSFPFLSKSPLSQTLHSKCSPFPLQAAQRAIYAARHEWPAPSPE